MVTRSAGSHRLRRPTPSPDPLFAEVSAACGGRHWAPGARILVAVSGGADSVALLALLRDINRTERRRWSLTAAHLDHGLRGAAGRRDAEFVRDLCRRWKIPCRRGRIDLTRDLKKAAAPLSMENEARQARYAFLRGTAEAEKAELIVTAHTLDDQAETVLFRVLRGAGLRGLRGILPVRRLGPRCRIVRPMLGVSKESLRCWLRAHRLRWREDRSNVDRSRPRNRLRHDILPLLARRVNPNVREALARLARTAAQTHRWMERRSKRWMVRNVRGGEVAVSDWRRLPAALRPVVALRLLRGLGAPEHPLTSARLSAIDRLTAASPPWPAVTLPGGIRVRRKADQLRFESAALG